MLRGFARVSRLALLVALTGAWAALGPAPAGSAAGRVRLRSIGAAPRVPAGATNAGAVQADATVSGALLLRPRDEPALESFIAAVTDRSSPQFGHYLRRGQFAERFGASASAIAAVRAQLTGDGLHVEPTASDGLSVAFSGSAARVESAFATGIERYRLHSGAVIRATTSAPTLPSAIAGSVAAVVGLDQLHAFKPLRPHRSAALAAGLPAAKSGSFAHPAGSPDACKAARAAAASFGGLTDDQIAHAYGAFGLYEAGDTGSGVSIGVFEQEPFLISDIERFDRCYFGSAAAAQMAARLHLISLEGGVPSGPGSDGEALLDVEDVSAMAPGANIDVYENPETAGGEVSEIAAMVEEDRDQIITSSYGQPCEEEEQDGQPGTQQAFDFLFQQAAAQGQTFLGAAGDNGSDSCEETHREPSPQPGQNPISTGEIASQPYVLAVGGTTITDAATQPAQEHVWNDGPEGGAGGGGISQAFAMPSWQRHSAVPGIEGPGSADYLAGESVQKRFGYRTGFCDSTLPAAEAGTPCRLDPDVSAQADEYTGAITVYSEQYKGEPGPESSHSGWVTSGGTSSATPIWAGMLALADASPTCRSNPSTASGIGFASPLLYTVASNPAAYAASFNDITEGNIDQYGLDDGKVYPARTGFDLASGLGSPRMTDPDGAAGLAYYLCSYAAQGAGAAVTGLTPSSGSTVGGERVTVAGSGFETSGSPDVAGVQVGAWQIPAASVHVSAPGSLTITMPPARDTLPAHTPLAQNGAGPVDVIVTLTDGASSSATAASTFQYLDTKRSSARPSITGIEPSGGSETAPAPITILGSGFAQASSVTFGGVPAASFEAEGDSRIRVTPPPYSAHTACAPLPSGGAYAGESAANDICQVQVVVHDAAGESDTARILPPFEGAPAFEQDGALVAPLGCRCEVYPAVSEYDYAPTPAIASVSTSAGASSLASELGGTLVTVHGDGLSRFTLDYANFGELGQVAENPYEHGSIVYESGTEMQVVAPALVEASEEATVKPKAVPLSVRTLAGESAPASVRYAGILRISGVANAASSVRLQGVSGAADTGGTPLSIEGSGMAEQVTLVRFEDSEPPPSEGTNYTFTTSGDKHLSTETVAENPALANVRVCSVTGCSATSSSDLLYLYPPGQPAVESLSPHSGSASGGTKVTIHGQNLGCPLAVAFGASEAESFTPVEAVLACGSTATLDAVSPPGSAGSKVPVTVTTLESYFTGSGDAPSNALFSYTSA